MTSLTLWQLAAAKAWDLDFQHVDTLEGAREVGDSIFAGLMAELDPREDCDSVTEARRRVASLARQLAAVACALDNCDGEPLDLSGGDPGYVLIASDGPVILTLECADDVIERKAAFATIADAETYLSLSKTIDPIALHEGRYGIDAPHGCTSDDEALRHARARGFTVFWKNGAAYYSPPNSGDVSKAFETIPMAALAALATVDPD